MREVVWAKSFKKDYKRELRDKYVKVLDRELGEVVLTLTWNNQLDRKYCDHALIGNLQGYRDCHLFFDLVLIYQYRSDNELILIRLGSHT